VGIAVCTIGDGSGEPRRSALEEEELNHREVHRATREEKEFETRETAGGRYPRNNRAFSWKEVEGLFGKASGLLRLFHLVCVLLWLCASVVNLAVRLVYAGAGH